MDSTRGSTARGSMLAQTRGAKTPDQSNVPRTSSANSIGRSVSNTAPRDTKTPVPSNILSTRGTAIPQQRASAINASATPLKTTLQRPVPITNNPPAANTQPTISSAPASKKTSSSKKPAPVPPPKITTEREYKQHIEYVLYATQQIEQNEIDIERLNAEAAQHGINAERHRQNALQHDLKAQQHDLKAEQHRLNAEKHQKQTEQNMKNICSQLDSYSKTIKTNWEKTGFDTKFRDAILAKIVLLTTKIYNLIASIPTISEENGIKEANEIIQSLSEIEATVAKVETLKLNSSRK